MRYIKRVILLLLSYIIFGCSLTTDLLNSDGNLITNLPDYKTKLPSYEQFDFDGISSGCVPTAFAMATGYWYLKHDIKSLYTSTPPLIMNSEELDEMVVSEIKAIRTSINTNSLGISTPSNALNFTDYLEDKYILFDEIHLLSTTEWNIFNWKTIYNNIEKGNPVIVFYTRDNGSNHAGIITQVDIATSWFGWYSEMNLTVYSGSNYSDGKPGIDYISSENNDISYVITFSLIE